ncbi:hypothetical protein BKK52_11190 [Rodentibacter trehalosifermentans]|uniref:Lipoprotein n=1 Tax=Rodentibacter trehalosifermentans TaxID=1908263 RepID=A0A1V3IWG5_9PAST|nr:hypothetical protein [Rodentibacter trehalosifermentans]OOF46638.1 hypothetical protein BKK52_11190 [Rodentibacter trehalosifermentans]
MINKKTLIFPLIFILTSCFSERSYFVRYWNGDVIRELTHNEKMAMDFCTQKTSHMSRKTIEDRNIANKAHLECISEYINNK